MRSNFTLLLGQGSVYSGSARRDDCRRALPDCKRTLQCRRYSHQLCFRPDKNLKKEREREREREKDRDRDRETDRQTDWETDRQTETEQLYSWRLSSCILEKEKTHSNSLRERRDNIRFLPNPRVHKLIPLEHTSKSQIAVMMAISITYLANDLNTWLKMKLTKEMRWVVLFFRRPYNLQLRSKSSERYKWLRNKAQVVL